MKLILIAIGLVFAFCIIKVQTTPAPPPDPAVEAAQKSVQDSILQLRSSMRNPESFKLTSALVIDKTGVVCYEYRAQNGFGGMNASKAVAFGPLLTMDTYDTRSAFVRSWNRQCAGKSGTEMRNYANAAIEVGTRLGLTQ